MLFGIFIYDGVEPIDLATFGVLSMARRLRPEIVICTIAPDGGPNGPVVRLANGLQVVADYAMENAPPVDVLVVTGGPGWVAQSRSARTLEFMRARSEKSQIASVCTGGMILAASGILNGHAATTKIPAVPPEVSPLEQLRQLHPEIEAHAASLVDQGGVITGGGVSLCIDTMLHLLAKLFGADMAAETARIIEYERAWAANIEQFPPLLAKTA
jgi:transcriptional regulator GlxA family with amidase domain